LHPCWAPRRSTFGQSCRRRFRKNFEHAVVIGHRGERDESLREQLAKFLHDRHARTQQAENGDRN